MSRQITPRVFVSAVSADLRSARKVVNDALTQLGCLPVEESIAGTEYGPISDMVRRWIGSCDAVIHLVGECYGGEPDPQTLPADESRKSWTQMEYYVGVKMRKKLYVIICDEDFPFDTHQAEESTGESTANSESDEKRALQSAHRQKVIAGPHLWHTVRDMEELRERVLQLKLPLEEVGAELKRQQFRRRLQAGVVAATIVLLLAGLVYVISRTRQAVDVASDKVDAVQADLAGVGENIDGLKADVDAAFADPTVMEGKLRNHINNTADANVAEARKTYQNAAERADAVNRIEAERKLALAHVADVVETIRAGLAGTANPVYVDAAEFLVKDGVDAALTYLEKMQSRIVEDIDSKTSRIGQMETGLEEAVGPLMLMGSLYEANLEWDKALQAFEQAVQHAPQWYWPAVSLADVLRARGEYDKAEFHLLSALRNARNDEERDIVSYSLIGCYTQQGKFQEAEKRYRELLPSIERRFGEDSDEALYSRSDMAVALVRLSDLSEAEKHYRHVIAVGSKKSVPNEPMLSDAHDGLAQVLTSTGRLEEAEQVASRGLEIEERINPRHPRVAIRLTTLAAVKSAREENPEAEKLLRRALKIQEDAYGENENHVEIARSLNNLAKVNELLGRYAEAERLIRRSIQVWKSSPNAVHPDLAVALANLGQLAQQGSRFREAGKLYREALRMSQEIYGVEHPNVATNLLLLSSVERDPIRAERLTFRALAISLLFDLRTGHPHPEHETISRGYLASLQSAGMDETAAAKVITDARYADIPNEQLRGATIAQNAGIGALHTGEFPAAIEHFNLALQRARQAPATNPKRETTMLTLEANLAAAMVGDTQFHPARESLLKLIPRFDKHYPGPHLGKARTRYTLAVCERDLGNFDEAERWVVESLQKFDELSTSADPVTGMRQQSEQLYRELLHRRGMSATEIDEHFKKPRPPADIGASGEGSQ